MPGPQPKDPSVRARRNTSPSARVFEIVTPHVMGGRDLPAVNDKPWHVLTLAWWADLWASPMSAEYLKVDEHGLIRLAVLIDAFYRKPSHYLAAEIRQQEQRYGLSPMDRRRLEWTIEQAEESKDRGRRRREGSVQPALADDPRNALRAV